MKKQLLYLLAIIAVGATVLMIGCQKELSFEGSNNPAKGSLQSDLTGDCLPKTVNGIYAVGTALIPATNTITVQVNVTQTGTYVVTTDTVNGYFFRGVGTFTTLGANTVTLRGNGTPFAAGINNFVVSFDGTVCDLQVDVLPAGAGAAVYTTNCAAATANGTYQVGINLTASNTITIPVTTITTPGTYNLTASINGMTFSGSGNLTTAPATITLNGVTTTSPTGPAGSYNLMVGSCTIPITVAAAAPPAVYTLDCANAVVNGTYQVGTNLTAANFITIPVATITTPGSYNISVSLQGMTFTGSGNLTTTPATITLTGVTTTAPAAPAGTASLVVGSCNIPITITPATGGAAVYMINCGSAIVNGFYEQNSDMNPCNTVDIDVNVTTPGTYTITTSQAGITFAKSGTFAATGTTNIKLQATGKPTSSGVKAFNFPAPSSCSFNVTVDAESPPYDWQFSITNLTPSAAYRGQNDFGQIVAGPTPGSIVYAFAGSNSLGSDDFQFALLDANGTIAAGETYSSSASTGNAAAFQYGTDCDITNLYQASPSISGVTMTFTISTHSVATQTITGTFSGTAKRASGQTITVATGTFTGTY